MASFFNPETGARVDVAMLIPECESKYLVARVARRLVGVMVRVSDLRGANPSLELSLTNMHLSLLAFMLGLVAISAQVVDVTQANFDSLVKNGSAWMVDIYAPWCSHCRQLEQPWYQLSLELAAIGIKTGKVDGPANTILMSRFKIKAFPSIFLLKEGQCWEYMGPRTVAAMKEWAVSGHLKTTPLPFYHAPNSKLGMILGRMYRIPSDVKNLYTSLKTKRGLSDLAIVGMGLAIPVAFGIGFICILDHLAQAQARREGGHDQAHLHAE